jgi:DNA helicase-2/ATP-dependent DNA helicase PcrA
MLFGSTQYNPPSRFLDEIPGELIEPCGDRARGRSRSSYRSSGSDSWGDRPRSGAGRGDEHRDRVVESALAAGRRPTPPSPSGAEGLGLRTGDDVRHAKFGEGVIIAIEGSGDKAEAVVRFRDIGEKRLLLAWSPLARVG